MQDDVHSGGTSNTPAQRTCRTPNKFIRQRMLIDWVGFTFSLDTYDLDYVLNFFQSMLGISKNIWISGRRNYEGYAHSLQFENIIIYYGGSQEQGIHVDITGQGCRFLEIIYRKLGVHKINWYVLLNELQEMDDLKFSRIDVAYDDMQGLIDVQHLFEKCLAGELTMKFKQWMPIGKFRSDGSCDGLTLRFGSRDSRIQIRIYEKHKQLELDEVWNRIEIQFNHERGEEFIKQFVTFNEESNNEKIIDIGVIFAGVLKDYITFRDKNPNDTNKRRWPVSDFWDKLLNGIDKVRLASSLPDRSIMKTAEWFNKSIAKSFAMLNLAFGGIHDKWLLELNERGLKKITEKELRIIEEYRRLHDIDYKTRIDTDETVWEDDNKSKRKKPRNDKQSFETN